MSEGFPYADIVILALIAGFILLRLRSILGDKTGNENSDFFKRVAAAPKSDEPIVQLGAALAKPKKEEPDIAMAGLSPAVTGIIYALKAKDPQFTATGFLEGARRAFEMTFDAFKEGDRPTLKMLLADAPFQHFSTELDTREKTTYASETTLVSVAPKEITQAALDGSVARLTVKFLSEQVTVVRGNKGEIIEGDASAVHHVENEWTFERDTASKNPNWKITET